MFRDGGERRATYTDLEAVPPHLVAELVDGELYVSPRPEKIGSTPGSADSGPLWGQSSLRGTPPASGGWEKMIRVREPADPPEVLRTTGTRSRGGMSAAYSRDPRSYEEGRKSFELDSGIYAHATVKQALREAQHDKCAFCESKFAHISYGDVEHFRPKAGWRQEEGEPLTRPGYYWLAYEWANLFLSCTPCNQRFKRNLFPLQTPTRRARSHKDDVTAEAPLLLDPAVDDPEAFISFREEVPYAVEGNARGEATIRILGLQRRGTG